MFTYSYDTEYGGLIIDRKEGIENREPRPVYADEMDYLGLDKYFEYDRQLYAPYMWNVRNNLMYRGFHLATMRGGDYFNPPKLIVNETLLLHRGDELYPVDLDVMIDKNQQQVQILEDITVGKTRDIYNEFKGKVDFFKVAFSGGKDSVTLLDIVEKAIPERDYYVVFSDTTMEYPETYDVIAEIQQKCESEGVKFITAKSHIHSLDSWREFGPPSRKLRWCHMVHKIVPSTLLVRELSGKTNAIYLDFVGVRLYESSRRKHYEYLCYDKKQKGQYSFNTLLEWTSAEVWSYIFANNLIVHPAYKKGHARVGCIVCPMCEGRKNNVKRVQYPGLFNDYMNIVTSMYEDKTDDFFNTTRWGGRCSGHVLQGNESFIDERLKDRVLTIDVRRVNTNWKTWMKTVGPLYETADGYIVEYEGKPYSFKVDQTDNGYFVTTTTSVIPSLFTKNFRIAFRKAAYCIGCKTCEANCSKGILKFVNGKPVISGDCNGCHKCNEINSGCVRYDSLKRPKKRRNRNDE